MTDKQPEALRIADELMGAANSMPADKRGWFDDKDEGTVPHNVCTDAAAELRRLDALNAELVEALNLTIDSIGRFTSDEASTDRDFDILDNAIAVLAKAEGK